MTPISIFTLNRVVDFMFLKLDDSCKRQFSLGIVSISLLWSEKYNDIFNCMIKSSTVIHLEIYLQLKYF